MNLNQRAYCDRILRIDLTPPEDTELKLFYQTKARREYCEQQCLKRPLRGGRNTLYLELPVEPPPVGRLRLDPGRHAGKYTIHAIDLFEFLAPQALPAGRPAKAGQDRLPPPTSRPEEEKATLKQLQALGYF